MPIEKVQLSIFDVFGFVIPGFIVCLAAWILLMPTLTISTLLVSLGQLNLGQILMVGLVSYIVGFVLNTPGYTLHTQVGLRLWRISKELQAEGMDNSKKNVLIREFSPANLVYLEKWLSYRAFSHNLALALLLLGICLVSQYFITKLTALDALLWGVIALLSVFPLLYRAQLYQRLYYMDLGNTYKELKLQSKAAKSAESGGSAKK